MKTYTTYDVLDPRSRDVYGRAVPSILDLLALRRHASDWTRDGSGDIYWRYRSALRQRRFALGKEVTMTKQEYSVHAATIDADGLHLSAEPRVRARTLGAALRASEDVRYHGPEGAAIVLPSGRVIWTREEYEAAYAATAIDGSEVA